MKKEKEAMAKALDRLQTGGSGSAADREDWRIRDVVRTLEEQLVKERARSQRSTSKRCQEQRLLMEQVKVQRRRSSTFALISAALNLPSSSPAGGAESVRVCSPCSGPKPQQ